MLAPPQGVFADAAFPGSIDLSDIVNIADQRLLGNVSGGAAAPSSLTRTQALALLSGGAAASDVAPTAGLLNSQHAYAQATVNTAGAAMRLAGGIGRRLVTVVDYTLIDAATDTITVTANGTATVGTEGTEWTAATSNAATAASIASWINGLANVSAVAVGSSVYVTPDSTCYSLTLATSMAAGEGTVTSGTDGGVVCYFPNGSVGAPSIFFSTNTQLGLYKVGATTMGVAGGGGSACTTFGTDSGQNVIGMFNASTALFGWYSSAISGIPDLYIHRLGAANLRQGAAPSATPIAQTFTLGEASRPGTDTDIAGANGTVQSGLGTGAAAASSLIFQTPTLVASGTGAQSYATRLTIATAAITATVPYLAPDGAIGAPAYSWSSQSNTGLYGQFGGGFNTIFFSESGTVRLSFLGQSVNASLPAFGLNASSEIGWSSGAPTTGVFDLFVGRLGAASLRQGHVPSATPVAQTFTLGEASRPGTDTNVGGASGTLRPGLGTGTGTASSLTLQGVVLAASGTDTQTYQDMIKITGVSLGFYNHAVTAQQTGVAVTAAAIHAALVNLGLITA